MPDIIAIFIIWNIGGALIVSALSADYNYNLYEYLSPISIYHNTNLNVFGCIVLTVLRNILCPLMSIIYWIGVLLYWLMTVGRK